MNKRIQFNATQKETNKTIAKEKVIAKKMEDKNAKKYFSVEESYKHMTKEQKEIMQHPATDIVMITGKDFGKGYMIGLKMLGFMEEDYRASGFALKKYKTNAAERLNVTFQNLSRKIKLWGYTVPDYEKGQNKTYRMKNKMKLNNQSIEYAGFDDYNSITGAEAYNVGYFPMAFFDEPSQMGEDPSKLTTQENWDMRISAMKSSMSRSNADHMRIFKRTIQSIQFYFALNPWDEHPLVKAAEKILPEQEFMNYILKDLLNNHTMKRYDEENDKLYVRGTMFGNPMINVFEKLCVKYDIKSLVDFNEKKDTIDYSDPACEKFYINNNTLLDHLKRFNGIPIYIQAQKAINQKDTAKLAEILGMKYVGKSKYKPIYDLTNVKLMNTDEVLKNMDDSTMQFVSWDVDQRKGGRFLATPVWTSYKTVKGKTYKNIIVGKQREIPSMGVGKLGQRIDLYVDKMYNHCKDEHSKFKSHTFKETRFIFDNNGKNYVNSINKLLNPLGAETPIENLIRLGAADFKNRKHWLIPKRQSWLQTSIDFGYLIIDEDNVGLLKNLKQSVSKEGNRQRDESGAKANVYDRINSMEYALYYVRGELSANFPPGDTEIYKTTQVEIKEIKND